MVKRVNEGNPISNKLPISIDAFLQDIAQVHGGITYNDIMKFDPDESKIKELKKLRAKYNKEAQYNDEESEKSLASISKEVVRIIKNESLSESYEDGRISISLLREAISNLEELVDEMEINDISSVKASPNTYGLGSFFLGTSSGYINLNDVYSYIPDDEDDEDDYDEEYESLREASGSQNLTLMKALKIAAPWITNDQIAKENGELVVSIESEDAYNTTKKIVRNLKSAGFEEITEFVYDESVYAKDGVYVHLLDTYEDSTTIDLFVTNSSPDDEDDYDEEYESLTEATSSSPDYRVVHVTMDVAMPSDKRLEDYGVGGGGSDNRLFSALSKALESQGLEMAGDYIDTTGDVTSVYKENDYEFFNESLKESYRFYGSDKTVRDYFNNVIVKAEGIDGASIRFIDYLITDKGKLELGFIKLPDGNVIVVIPSFDYQWIGDWDSALEVYDAIAEEVAEFYDIETFVNSIEGDPSPSKIGKILRNLSKLEVVDLNESKSINENISELEIASVLNDARDNAADFGITDEFTNEYYIGQSVSAFGYPLEKLFMFLPDHISEEDKEYQDAIKGWKENEQMYESKSLKEGTSSRSIKHA